MPILTYGADEGYSEPGVPGATNPFPHQNLHADVYSRLAKNRIAGLSNKTCDFEPSHNDVLYSHRATYTRRFNRDAINPKILGAYDPGLALGYSAAGLSATPRAASGTVLDATGKLFTTPGNLVATKGGAVSSAVGLVLLPVVKNNEVFAQWLTVGDTDLAAGTKYLVRATDVNNWIGIHRQSATNLRVERDVATVVTTERDITVPATTPATGNALGVRLSGTSASVFLNGTKVDEWTLNAAAQGLAGTQAGLLLAASGNVNSLLDCFEVWSLN